LAGRNIKGYDVALEVFGRPETFDPTVDPVVRVEAGRLREKLREYYGALAVLPFDDLSAEQNLGYLGDGVAVDWQRLPVPQPQSRITVPSCSGAKGPVRPSKTEINAR
jgi:hypothetical protein